MSQGPEYPINPPEGAPAANEPAPAAPFEQTTPEPQQPPPASPPTTPAVESNADARLWAMLTHFSAFSGYVVPLGWIVGPIICWQVNKNQYPFVDYHGKEAVNFQVSFLIYAIVAAVSTVCFGIGLVLLPIVAVFQIVFVIIAGIKANQGELYRYPLTIRLIK
jgi:hypothetical protein